MLALAWVALGAKKWESAQALIVRDEGSGKPERPGRFVNADLTTNALCQRLALVVPTLTPLQRSALLGVYKAGVIALVPLGWITALRGRSRIGEIRVFALGVKPEFQHTGVAAGLYRDIWDACLRRDIYRVETGWILEVNQPMNRAMEALTGRIVKRYRLYERLIDPAAAPAFPASR